MSGRFPNEPPVISDPTGYSRIRKRILAAGVNGDNGEERVKQIQPNWIGLTFCLALLLIGSPSIAPGEQPPNVLFLVVDDLNDWVGCLGGHPQAQASHNGSKR